MKKRIATITAFVMTLFFISPTVMFGGRASAELPQSAKLDNDMEVKTYLKEITRPLGNPFADEGGRIKISGWDLNQIGGTMEINYAQMKVTDSSPVLPVEGKREFETITYGDIEMYFDIAIGGGIKDAAVSLREGNTPAILYGFDGVNIWVQTPKGKQNLLIYKTDVTYLFDTVIHMDSKTFDVYIDHRLYAQGIKFDTATLDNFFFTTGKESVGSIAFPRANFSLKRGYWIDETFGRGNEGILPPSWTMKSVSASGAERDTPVFHQNTPGIRVGGTDGKTTLLKPLGTQTRDFTVEYYMRMPEGCNDASVRFTGGGKTVFEIFADETNLYYRDAAGNPVKAVDSYKKDLWYVIWAEVNLTGGTFDLYIEDRAVVKNVPLPAGANTVDTFEAVSGDGNHPCWLSYVQVYPTERFDDYVPEPNRVPSDGVDIGMQYFGLWNEGGHFGWEVVEDSDFRFPLDGGYDEDSVEHWDWQIKYWLEHGIDYVAPCYYAPDTRVYESERMRTPFFKARYSDQMKYALIWETAGWNAWDKPEEGMEIWLKHCGRNLIEYYFKNPKYYTNGGRPVVFMFGWEDFSRAFGTCASQVLERLGDMCEAEGVGRPLYILHFDIGFDNWDSGSIEGAKALNADAFYHYSTAGASWPEDVMSKNARHLQVARENDFAYVPTVSGGFDDYAWNRTVGTMYDGEQVSRAVENYKNNLLPKDSGLATPMLNLATWNEWGEGHYFGPSKGFGFSYLDAVRKHLTNGGEHTDITPTEHQKDRFNNLYPYWRNPKKREENVGKVPAQNAYEKYVWNFDNPASLGWVTKNTTIPKLENGVWKLTAENNVIIQLTDSGIDTEAVTHIKIRMKNKGGGNSVSTDFVTPFWNTSTTKRTIHSELTARHMQESDDFIEYYIPVGIYREFWRGILDGMTIIIDGYQPGEGLEIDSIAFMALPKEGEVTVSIDGWSTSDTPVKLQNGLPMLPLRDIVYKLKGQVWYDNDDGQVWVKNGDTVTAFYPGGDAVVCDGKSYTLPGSSALEEGSTWVNGQILALAFQKNASWDAEEKIVSLSDATKQPEVTRPNTDRKLLGACEFDDLSQVSYTGGMEGFSINNGVAEFTTSNNDPQMKVDMPTDLSEAKLIAVGLKSNAAFELKLYFATADNPSLAEGRTFQTYVTASNDIREYVIDATSHSAFSGKLDYFRVDTGDGEGIVCGVDYVRVYGDFERELTQEELDRLVDCRTETRDGMAWDFNFNTNRDGWRLSRSLANAELHGGVMTADIICKAPFIETAETCLSLDASQYHAVKFCMRNATASTKARVYFTTVADPVWSEDKSAEVSLSANSGINIAYTADVSQNPAWKGTIRALRIAVEDMDARENRGEIGFDYVKLLKK